MKYTGRCIGVIMLLAGFASFSYSAETVENSTEEEVLRGYEDISETRKSKLEERGGINVADNESRIKLAELRVTAENKDAGDETLQIFGGRLTYASLFSQQDSGLYNGFYRIIGKLDSDSMGRLNLTGGYHLFDGASELLLGYRFLYEKIRALLPVSGDYDEHGLENALAARFTYYPEGFVRVLSADILVSRLEGESTDNILITDIPEYWSRVFSRTGYGAVDSVATTVGFAIGSDDWDSEFIQGGRLDFDGGYEEVQYGGFDPFPDQQVDGFLGIIRGTLVTSYGVWTAEYQTGQAADMAVFEWQRGNVRVFIRDTDYFIGSDETLIGAGVSGTFSELADPLNFLRNLIKPKRVKLFQDDNSGYDDIRTTGRFDRLENDQFIAKPEVIEVVESSAAVFRGGLPGDTTLDTGEGKLIVRIPCTVDELSSINPNSASTAFSNNGDQVNIYLANLPQQEQTIVVRAEQRCGGSTDIYVNTNGEGAVTRVRTRDNPEVVPEADPVDGTSPSGGGVTTVIVLPQIP